ncbi:MAG: cation:proton antiporter [Pseudomonadota bacterium]
MGENLVLEATRLVAQLSIILIAAKLGAELCVRFLKQPAVLGELLAGVFLSPFLFGRAIPFLEGQKLFPLSADPTNIPISTTLFAIAQIGAVVLLFVAGLETNLKQFLKYAWAAILIAIGGIVLPFFLGAYITVLFGLANHLHDATALFVGSILTATSVGITARVLDDLKKLDSPEGVTILGAAIVDDVLGILVLSIVIAVSYSQAKGGHIDLPEIGIIGLRAIGFWIGLIVVGVIAAPHLERLILRFKTRGSKIPLALAICFIASFLAEGAGLAMIIGAYAIGLALSSRPIAKELIESIQPLFHFLVPIFFVVTGMMVNLLDVGSLPLFALVLTIAAIASKWLGCFLPAWGCGFSKLGASRIGVGMIPRGEIALIIAQVGIAKGLIDTSIYGTAIIIALATTLVAPIWMASIFKNNDSGLRRKHEKQLPRPIST